MSKIIILCIILLIGIGQITHRNNKIDTLDINTKIQAPEGIQESKAIQTQGDIQADNNFPLYTHSLTLSNGAKIGLKSSSINLNIFSGIFEVVGIVSTIKKGLPIIDVEYIKNNERKYFVQDNVYTYIQEDIIIDLTNLGTIYSFSDTGNIYIISDNVPIITMRSFTCNDVSMSTDCETYRNNALKEQSDSFISDRGVSFYKIDDGKRIVFNESRMGYIIEGDDDDIIIDFSSTIQPINSAYILRTYRDEIFAGCNDLEQINTASIQKNSENIVLTVQGIDDTKNNVGCNITIDMRNRKGITNISVF